MTESVLPEQSSPRHSADAQWLEPPLSAALEDPLYYLQNADTVIRWVLRQHADLLTDDELRCLHDFLRLADAERGLLVRMIMRTGEVFRVETLHYPELASDSSSLVDNLCAGGWLVADPQMPVRELFGLFRKDEIYPVFKDVFRQRHLPSAARKSEMASALEEVFGTRTRPASRWLEGFATTVVHLAIMPLFERVRLMFFGNLYQDWSEFVVTRLGHLRYEPVALSRESRAFQCRREVDAYLQLHRQSRQLEESDCLDKLWGTLPGPDPENPWLDYRRRRLLFRVGHRLERRGDIDRALTAYRWAWNEEARIRYFRVQEKLKKPALSVDLVNCYRQSRTETEQLLLGRILRRIDKSNPLAQQARLQESWTTERISLPRSDNLAVELLTAEHFCGEGATCFYVENGLFNSLLGLLFWPAIFAPVQGAFFHPFQSGPADLFREDFVTHRQAVIDRCFEALEDGAYPDRMRTYLQSRRGISCPLINWQLLDEQLLELALHCISPRDLQQIFRRMLGDLRRHSSGFPDLIRFWPEQRRYELIEVKGPGDRLQDHQKLWLRYFSEHNIPARVCHVDWREPS